MRLHLLFAMVLFLALSVILGRHGMAADLASEKGRILNVMDFGVSGSGTIDDTQAVQFGIAAAQKVKGVLYFPRGTYQVTRLVITGSMVFSGDGEGSVIMQKEKTVGPMITVTGSATTFTAYNVGFDGNQANQGSLAVNKTILFSASGTSSTPAILNLHNCLFLNGDNADIWIDADERWETIEEIMITSCRFIGGREGINTKDDPRAINIVSPVRYVIANNMFDLAVTPVKTGRAGVVVFDGEGGGDEESRGVISGNSFNGFGRSEANSTLGVIDLYSRGRSVSIIGNSISNAYGRAIQCKADANNIAIVGNVIDSLEGLNNVAPNAMVSVNSSVNSAANGNVTITGNALYNSKGDGIIYTGRNKDNAVYADSVIIASNSIKMMGRRGINVADVENCVIEGNSVADVEGQGIVVSGHRKSATISGNLVVRANDVGIYINSQVDGASANIQGNNLQNSGSSSIRIVSIDTCLVGNNSIESKSKNSAIDVSSVSGILKVTENMISAIVPYGYSDTDGILYVQNNTLATVQLIIPKREIVISTNGSADSIKISLDWHRISGRENVTLDRLERLDGGCVGRTVTLFATDGSRPIVIKNKTANGNISIGEDYLLDGVTKSVTLMFDGTVWRKISST